jgi:hypothetical protein
MAAIVANTRYDYRNAVPGIPYDTGTLLKAADGATVHIVDANYKLRAFKTAEDFLGMGFKWDDIISVDRSILRMYGPELTEGGVGTGSWGTFISAAEPLVLDVPVTAAADPNPELGAGEQVAEPTVITKKSSKKYLFIGAGVLLVLGYIAYKMKKS